MCNRADHMTKYPKLSAALGIKIKTSMYNNSQNLLSTLADKTGGDSEGKDNVPLTRNKSSEDDEEAVTSKQ